jgi:S-adenosylmethionine decarboxylase
MEKPNEVKMGLGQHLTLDLYGCNKENLINSSLIYKILDKLPEMIGMHKISEPSISFFQNNPLGNEKSFDKGGISGFVLISESHITIHTFANQNFASIDIFSCK